MTSNAYMNDKDTKKFESMHPLSLQIVWAAEKLFRQLK